VKRALVLALVAALLLRLGPTLLAFVSPRFRARARAIGRRLDVVGALAMLGWTVGLLTQRAFVEAAVVGLISIPVVVAGVVALRS